MKKTVVLLEINHDKSLPDDGLDVTSVVAQRLYGWLLNAGVTVDVKASLLGTFEGAGE